MQIQTPDIGVEQALVAEILVKVGDQIAENDSIVLLESDKASVEVPSPAAGVVKSILVTLGQHVQEGAVLIELDSQTASVAEAAASSPAPAVTSAAAPVVPPEPAVVSAAPVARSSSSEVAVTVPDIGVEKALIAEVLVKVGDQIAADDSVVLVESDKASVEVPSPVAGEVLSIAVKAGDSVKEGVLLLKVKSNLAQAPSTPAVPAAVVPPPSSAPVVVADSTVESSSRAVSSASVDAVDKLSAAESAENAKYYAGPAVRQLARELGVLLADVKASGVQGRIVKDDVFAYVKTRLSSTPHSAVAAQVVQAASGLPPLPDFSGFGGGELKGMTRLQQVSVPQLSLNNFIPQVTQFELADITELEAWRNELKDGFKKQGISLTILAFIAKATAHLLKEEPYFAAHLADDQKSVLLRNEIHMGIAVATADGLTVPVLRHPDQKTIKQIAQELAVLSQKARDKKLSPKDLQGANFTITSLGSIGGTAFTPLVNWPQVAILGISPASIQPVWQAKEFVPRLMLPLSLSYDHRVINGADAARFSRKLSLLLQDIRNILL
jgi:pyruvate dehydrogenase E2 component (dihydrolipoamide acetyltransferase)